MDRAHLKAVVEDLVDLVDSWNDAVADEDWGRADYALCLTLFDDGSGRLGRRDWGSGEVEDLHSFVNLDDLVRVLADEGVELGEW
jgi:hypothetical protein